MGAFCEHGLSVSVASERRMRCPMPHPWNCIHGGERDISPPKDARRPWIETRRVECGDEAPEVQGRGYGGARVDSPDQRSSACQRRCIRTPSRVARPAASSRGSRRAEVPEPRRAGDPAQRLHVHPLERCPQVPPTEQAPRSHGRERGWAQVSFLMFDPGTFFGEGLRRSRRKTTMKTTTRGPMNAKR